MGQSCCVAARGKSLPSRNNHEASTFRNVRQSPTWSFRWDNRTHIEDIMENYIDFTHRNSGSTTSEVKRVVGGETDSLSDGESPPKTFHPTQWRKSFTSRGLENSKFIATDQGTSSNAFLNQNHLHKSPALPHSSKKLLVPTRVEDPSSSTISLLHSEPNSSQKAACSHAYQLNRQLTDSRIPSPEGSHGGSADGWSKRAFSELVASSQRERWSVEGENLAITGNILGSRLDLKEQDDLLTMQTCEICSKLLDEPPRSPHYYGHSVSAVLVCGHVFHADCLESLTPEAEIYDPPCHVCSKNGDQQPRKVKKRSLLSRTAAAADKNSVHVTRSGKGPVMVGSSSMKSSINRPFLKRHFSVGSRAASESESVRKKWFWRRNHRE